MVLRYPEARNCMKLLPLETRRDKGSSESQSCGEGVTRRESLSWKDTATARDTVLKQGRTPTSLPFSWLLIGQPHRQPRGNGAQVIQSMGVNFLIRGWRKMECEARWRISSTLTVTLGV